jgi:hypothetical protein
MPIERQDVHGGGLERHVLSVVGDSRRRRHHAEKQRRHRGDETHAEANDVLGFFTELFGRQTIANKRSGERAAKGAHHGDRRKGGSGLDEVRHLGASVQSKPLAIAGERNPRKSECYRVRDTAGWNA